MFWSVRLHYRFLLLNRAGRRSLHANQWLDNFGLLSGFLGGFDLFDALFLGLFAQFLL